jgi:rod shape-determining protein MreB
MLKAIMNKICSKYRVIKPRVVVGVPSGITEVEERAVEEAIISSGARNVFVIDEPMAAAIGAGLEVSEAKGNIVVDIGGGTTEVAVISLGGVVISESLRIAGDEITENIINYIKRRYNLTIGEVTAENIKQELGCAMPLMTETEMEIRGRDLSSGFPSSVIVTSSDIELAIKEPIEKIIETVKTTLEQTPPELVSDISETGITLTGGGALIKNLDKLMSEKMETPVYIANEPLDTVVNGTLAMLEDLDNLKNILKRNVI